MQSGFTFFDTAIGRCGIAWNGHGITATQLPEADSARAANRLSRRLPDAREAAPPPIVKAAIARIAAHLRGERVRYDGIVLDRRRVGAFERAVYDAAVAIPHGETRTYGALAASLGQPEAAQAVGQALGRNPWPIVVPCHRILGADGKVGGFSAPGGAATKLKLLEIEGALAPEALPLFGARD